MIRFAQGITRRANSIFPNNLDMRLEQRGYRKDALISFQTLSLKSLHVNNLDGITIRTSFDDDWLKNFMYIADAKVDTFLGIRAILKKIKMNICYVALEKEGECIGCGLGVLEDNYVGLFEIVVAQKERNKGYGHKIVNTILNWGKANGAQNTYLQVMLDNQSALSLYKKIGFQEEYKYWSRVKE